MEKQFNLKSLLTFNLVTLLFVSCTTEVDWENKLNEIKLDQSVVLPVGEAVITLDDVLNQFKTLDFLDSQGSDIFVNFNDSLEWGINEIPALGNAVPTVLPLQGIYFLPIVNGVRGVDLPNEMDLGINTNPDDQRIDQIKAKSAKIGIVITVENAVIQPSDIEIIYNFDSERLTFDSDGSSKISFKPQKPFGELEELDMPALTINLPNLASKIPNVMRIEIKAANTVLNPTSKITINFKYTKIEPKVLFGYFNPTLNDLSQEQIVDLSGFISKIPTNGKFMVEPEINFDLESTFGMNLRLHIDKLEALQAHNPSNIVKASFTENNIKCDSKALDIKRVMEYGGAPGTSKYTLSKLPAEGEIDKLFSQDFLPDLLRYKFHVSNFRVSKTPTIEEPADFVAPNQVIKAKLNIKVPLKLNAGSWFILKDTITTIKFDSLLKDDIISSAAFALNVTNGLPVKTTLGLRFIKADGTEIPDMNVLEDPVIPAPALTDQNKVDYTKLEPKLITLKLNKEQMQNLKLAKQVIIEVKIDSRENSLMIFEKENSFRIKFGAYVKGGSIIKFN